MPKAGAGRKENRADGVSVRIHTPTIISIYVPTWGTTAKVDNLHQVIEISIHVPTWGTTKPRRDYELQKHFNPRPHVGDDRRLYD